MGAVVELVGAAEACVVDNVEARSVGVADEGVAGGADTGWVVASDEDSGGGGGLAVQLTIALAVANDATSIRSLIRCPVLGRRRGRSSRSRGLCGLIGDT